MSSSKIRTVLAYTVFEYNRNGLQYNDLVQSKTNDFRFSPFENFELLLSATACMSVDHKLSDCSIMDDHQSSSKPKAELNDVVKRARIVCSFCGFERTSDNSDDGNDDPFDEFGCNGCAATKILINEDIPHIRDTHKSHSFYTSCHACSPSGYDAYLLSCCECLPRSEIPVSSDTYSDLPGIYELIFMRAYEEIFDEIDFRSRTVKGFLKIQSFRHYNQDLFKGKIVFTDELRKKGRLETSHNVFENGLTFVQTNKPINDNKPESFTSRLRGEIHDETKEYYRRSSWDWYLGTPVNLTILEKDYTCRWIPYDDSLHCTNNDAGELTTGDDEGDMSCP